MMDDIDDLFGDGTGLSLPSRPPSKELYQRVDDMRGSGCCQCVVSSFLVHGTDLSGKLLGQNGAV